MAFRHLLTGFDTIECAYYMANIPGGAFDFELLEREKGVLKSAKTRRPALLRLGSEEFLLATHGTGSGFPFLLENDAFSIQCGEFNKPNFFVIYTKLAFAITEMKKGTSEEVPSFMRNWRARHDSNVRPLPSEGSTLSS